MWVVLKQIVKVGSNQLKGYSHVSCYGILSRVQNGLLQRRLLSTEGGEQRNEKVNLNPMTQDAPYALTEAQQHYIAQGDPAVLQKLNALTLELYIKREKGSELPETISLDNLRIMLNLSPTRRKSFLKYLLITELRKAEARDQSVKERFIRPPSTSEHPWLENRVFGNTLFMRLLKQERNQVYNSNAMWGLLFGQKVIIDCSYNEYMDEIASKKAAQQIVKCYYSSRQSKRPFSMHICNLDFDSRLMYYLKKTHPGFENNVSIGIHAESYLELFDRESFIYLSPHSGNVLKYDPKDTYIIGGFVDVDTSRTMQLSAKKAKMENIRHAALPLDRYLKWKQGNKSLCINHCFDILLDVKNNGDWSTALRTHVPSRKF